MTNNQVDQKDILIVRNLGLTPPQIINVLVKCMGYKKSEAKNIVEKALSIDAETLKTLNI